MEFRTIIPIVKTKYPINYNSKIVSFGSCFAANMSEKFDYYKFQNLCNPFGIVFNAVSLEMIMQRIVERKYFTVKDIFENNGLWHCYEVHSCLSQTNKIDFLSNLNEILDNAHHEIKSASCLIITLGTSWIYQLNATKKVVANCHKMPQSEFSKILLSPEQNAMSINNIISYVQKINQNIRFTFTVSPVRHIKDGFFENNVSKSHLFAALYQIIDNDNVTYFPSYEIMMDDLRDYRFYGKDFLHPSEMAIDYIWEKFKHSQITKESFLLMDAIKDIQKMLSHRPLNIDSERSEKFTEKLQNKIQKIQETRPTIAF